MERAMFILAFLLCFLAGGLLFTLPRGAVAAETVGTVTKVERQGRIGCATAVVGTAVHMDDVIRTGPNGRMQITFRDNTLLTRGENARVRG